MRLKNGFIVLVLSLGFAYSQQSYEDFLRQDQAAQDAFTQQFLNEYNAYVEADRAAYQSFRDEIEGMWGDFEESTNRDWVEYGSDKTWRSDVDFENGQAKVEVLLSPKEAEDPRLVQQKLEQAVESVALSRGSTKDYSSSVEKAAPLEPGAVLAGQIVTSDRKAVTPSNVAAFARTVVTPKTMKKEKVRGKDGRQRVTVSVNFSLVPDHLQVRAKQYENLVKKYALKYKLDPALVYAVIHTESCFNPKATSPIPAYGLMQLVPKYAGRDAYKFVYNRDRVLHANYLYDAERNIELGTAYLHLLSQRYFADLRDETSRTYCIIAAYNTGAGNVSKAFTGSTNVKKALSDINRLSASQVYRTMKQRLPYDETKTYLDKVSERMKLYKK